MEGHNTGALYRDILVDRATHVHWDYEGVSLDLKKMGLVCVLPNDIVGSLRTGKRLCTQPIAVRLELCFARDQVTNILRTLHRWFYPCVSFA